MYAPLMLHTSVHFVVEFTWGPTSQWDYRGLKDLNRPYLHTKFEAHQINHSNPFIHDPQIQNFILERKIG